MDGFVYRIGSYSRLLGRPPIFYHSRDLVQAGCQFASIYAVRKEDAWAISQTAGTAAGFRGIVWSRRLWVDFDTTEPADRAEEFLKKEGLDYVAYNTGGRGRHLGVLRDAAPSHTLPLQDKLWVSEHLPGADMGLYWHLHLIRLPGAVHERTGRRKTLIGRHEGRELSLPLYVPDSVAAGPSPAGKSQNRQSIFKIWEVTSRLIEEPGGSRHKQLVALAVALKQDAGVAIDEAMWVVMEVNMGFEQPKDRSEIERIVRWAYGLEG